MHNEILRWTVSQVTSPKRSWINLINGRGNGWPFVVISSNLTKLGNKQFHTRVVLVWNSRINPRQANVNFLSWNIFLSSPFVWMTNSKKNSIDSIKKAIRFCGIDSFCGIFINLSLWGDAIKRARLGVAGDQHFVDPIEFAIARVADRFLLKGYRGPCTILKDEIRCE